MVIFLRPTFANSFIPTIKVMDLRDGVLYGTVSVVSL